MKKRHIALAALGLLAVGGATAAYVATPTVHEGAPGEAPELGRAGPHIVGTSESIFTLPDRLTFGKVGMATGQTEVGTREVDVRLYYPATAAGSAPIAYRHTMTPPAMEPFTLDFTGAAYEDAPPAAEGPFPLVIMSHGFNGWNTQISNLAEHVASRGYVVASIDHRDMPIEGMTDFLHSFALVLASRSLDQRGVLADILASAERGDDPVTALIDTDAIAVVGYSMGGYGALATAGGDYDYESGTFGGVPDDALAPVRSAAEEDAAIDAVVAFAPWGGQPDNRVWSEATLAQVTAPVLLVSGSEDDVSNYSEGVRWIFDSLTGTERHLLTFREARHNIVGNAFVLPEDAPFRAAEFLSEPVWRQDRINSINQHFVTAFLDLHLKGDESMRAFLDLPTQNANDGTWDVGVGEQLNGKFAGPEESEHWRGFQRRWALGLDFETLAAGD